MCPLALGAVSDQTALQEIAGAKLRSRQEHTRSQTYLVPFLLAIFTASLVPRVLIAIAAPAAGGDWATYSLVAENILGNGCVSLSAPESGICEPHWGGNHLPGYPAFVAGVWALFPVNNLSTTLAHSAVISAFTAYVALRLAQILSFKTAALTALLVAVSPLSIPWARFASTETLTLAASLWILAELLASYRDRRLRWFPLGLAFAVAIFLRYDNVLIAVPIAVAGFSLHTPIRAMRNGVLICLIAAVPLGAWWGRSVSAGLGLAPNPYFSVVHGSLPRGYLSWASTWVTGQYEALGYLYPIHEGTNYSAITIRPDVHANKQHDRRANQLIDDLTRYEGQPFPDDIDTSFAELARDVRSEQPVRQFIVLPAVRAWKLWFNPLNSAAWPVSLGLTGDAPERVSLVETALHNPVAAITKGGNAIYKLGLLLLTTILSAFFWRRLHTPARYVALLALSHAYARTLFLATGFFVESRYTLQAIPLLEVALVIVGTDLWVSRKDGRPLERQQA